MRYFLRDKAFVIRGKFTALLSGTKSKTKGEDILHVSTVIAAHLPDANTKDERQSYFQTFLAKNGYDIDTVNIAVSSTPENFCVYAYDAIMVFIHAERNRSDEYPGPVTVIVNSREPFPEEGLQILLDTATGARNQAFIAAGHPAPDPKTNAILICCETQEESPNEEERIKRAQLLISETITHGISEIWTPPENLSGRKIPFNIHSSIGGERWTQWNPNGCPYYPCHPSCTDQRCDFCYCPLYPCGDEALGKWLERENGGKIWSCEGCILVHEPVVADYLRLHPESSVGELKTVQQKFAEKEKKNE